MLSLPRRRESRDFNMLWIPAFAGMTFLEILEVIAKVFNSGIAALRSQRQMASMQSLRGV